jgi:IS5 family transposase
VLQIGRICRSRTEQGKDRLQQCYRSLPSITGRVVGPAKRFVREVVTGIKGSAELIAQLALEEHCVYLETMIPRVQQLMRQARERIFGGDTRSAGKLVSLFEPHTEIIRKGKAAKPTEFGKLIKFQEAEQQIVTH